MLTVVAKDVRHVVLVLCRHWLLGKLSIDQAKVIGHVSDRFEANGALIGSFAVSCVTGPVDAMPTWHKGHSRGAGKHVLTTDGTITFKTSFNAAMSFLHIDRHTDIACLAVEEVCAKATTCPTQAAFVTVVAGFLGVVVPKLALVAIVSCDLSAAMAAVLACWSKCHAEHAKHVFRVLTICVHNIS